MGKIQLKTFIQAPVERCFDLSRSVDIHILSAKGTSERAIGGITSGLMNIGDHVLWEARHFFIKQRLEVKIAKMERPIFFTDVQVSGIFDSFSHDHFFESKNGGTLMRDNFQFKCPLGVIGQFMADYIVTMHLTKFLQQRNLEIKRIAECEEWRLILK
jgi:ligand-binding SRPBCC domain-containing protein